MTLHFDRESQRADRIAKRERQVLYMGGARALVALGAFGAAIAFVFAGDGWMGQPHTARGLIAAAAVATPLWLLALWASRWREPKLAPYTFVAREGDNEQTIVRECVDDYAAVNTALYSLRVEGGSISVGRGPPEMALPLGVWTVVDGQADWEFLTPEWSFHSSKRRPDDRSRGHSL